MLDLRTAMTANLDSNSLRPRVLCVDDSEDMQAILRDFLDAEGYEVTVTGSAHSALRLLRSEHFHLLVTDQTLPDETGTWLLARAQSLGLLENLGAVVVTANSHPEDLERPAGVPVFQKPVHLDRFLGALADLLGDVRIRSSLRP